MTNESTISQLIVKLLRRTITAQERQELEAWRMESPANGVFLDKMTQGEPITAGLKVLAEMDVEKQYRWVPGRHPKYTEKLPRVPLVVRYRWRLVAAAVVAGIVCVGTYLLRTGGEGARPMAAPNAVTPANAAPMDVNRAVLTLADGRTIDLGKAQHGLLADQPNAQVYKLETNLISYTSVPLLSDRAEAGGAQSAAGTGDQYNTISVPHGARFRVMLPDHTEVVLNTGSTLRYPVSFSGRNRAVELKGEAIFLVKKDKEHPFMVSSDRLHVKVMGTVFAMRDYPDEPMRRTVLKEGAVAVSSKEGTARLQPGQEARIEEDASSLRVISGVDAENMFAWRRGYFNFDNLDIRAAIWQLAQWYGMRVSFAKDVRRDVLGAGNIQQDLPLPQLLKGLELPDLRFEIKDSTIVVTTN